MPYGDGPFPSPAEVTFIDGADELDEVAVIGCESRGVAFVDASAAATTVTGGRGEPEEARGGTESDGASFVVAGGVIAAECSAGCGVIRPGEVESLSLSLSSAIMPAAPTKDSYKYNAVVFAEVTPTELCCYVLRRSDKLEYRLHVPDISGHEQRDRWSLMQECKVPRIGRIASRCASRIDPSWAQAAAVGKARRGKWEMHRIRSCRRQGSRLSKCTKKRDTIVFGPERRAM